MKGRFWVISLGAIASLAITGCSSSVNPRVATRINTDASLVGDLPSNPIAHEIITTWVDRANGTASILYGNELAIRHARANAGEDYPAGSVLYLVTWSQQEDPRWFGGKIPSTPRSVEYMAVKTALDNRIFYDYELYKGMPLKKVATQTDSSTETRITYLLGQRVALMP